MDKLVRVLEQQPLVSREWTPENGQAKIIKSVSVKMTDGIDTFVGEATDQLAEVIDKTPLNKDHIHAVQTRIRVNTWKTKDGKDAMSNNITIIKIVEL